MIYPFIHTQNATYMSLTLHTNRGLKSPNTIIPNALFLNGLDYTANIHLFEIINTKTRRSCEILSKLAMKITEGVKEL